MKKLKEPIWVKITGSLPMAGSNMLHLAREDKNQLQLERLQSTLNRACRSVPFHQNRFQELQLEPSQILHLHDIERIPYMQRSHLGENYPYGLFAVPLRDIVRIHTAPGTTLKPTVSGYAKADLHMWRDIVSRGLRAAGVSAHDILHINLDPGLANWGRDYKDGAENIEASVIPNTQLSLEKQVMVLKDYKTSVLVTTPSFASQLVKYLFDVELNPTVLNLRTLIMVGEPASADFREMIENRLHVTTWLQYGLSEIPGPAVAFECQQHDGLHINEDHFLAEIIDPKTGEVLPEGETGELVLTTLSTRAFPLIRFRTGDQARFVTEDCPCGCSLTRMQWLGERTDDLLLIRGVKVHQQQILLNIERALGFAPACHHFIKKVHDRGSFLEVWMCVDNHFFSDEIKELQKRIHSVGEKLEENIGIPVSIKLKEKQSFNSIFE
jgi:phenylacetate-CoA ligase